MTFTNHTVSNNTRIEVYARESDAYKAIGNRIRRLIEAKQEAGLPAVLGLATGASPVGVYKELVRLHWEEQLSFRNVHTFNLDEYYPMHAADSNSYVYYMQQHLFNHIDIPGEQVHIPDGTIALQNVERFCREYDEKIKALGGIDLQLLGIGRTGHIGFNEPPAAANTPTRMVTLHQVTIDDAAKDFGGVQHTPTQAITMGIAPILQAKEICIMGWGAKKAAIIQQAIQGGVNDEVPASHLQNAKQVQWYVDEAAAAELKFGLI